MTCYASHIGQTYTYVTADSKSELSALAGLIPVSLLAKHPPAGISVYTAEPWPYLTLDETQISLIRHMVLPVGWDRYTRIRHKLIKTV